MTKKQIVSLCEPVLIDMNIYYVPETHIMDFICTTLLIS
jgi:hypothetical protein